MLFGIGIGAKPGGAGRPALAEALGRPEQEAVMRKQARPAVRAQCSGRRTAGVGAGPQQPNALQPLSGPFYGGAGS